MASLDALLRRSADRFGDRIAVVDDQVTLSHAGLVDGVDALAEHLSRSGVGRGDIVAFRLPNGLGAIEVFRACWAIGATAAPIHPAAGDVDTAALVARLHPAATILGAAQLDDLRRGHPPDPPGHAPRRIPDDVAVLLATSGSTGTPKLVALTHDALTHKASQMPAVHGLDEHDVVLMPAPMSHMSGLLNGVLLPGAAGMACVPMARWRPDEALALMEAHRVTFMVGPPTFFVGLLDDPTFVPERVAALRLVSSGGAGVTPAFVRRATQDLGATVKRTYGSTEAPTVATSRPGDDPSDAAERDGRLLEGVDARLVDPATGAAVAGAGPGELCLRGPELFAGYLTDEGILDPARDDAGWFHTGDLAILADGWLTITGRLKDLIIRGGENIAASEIEEVLERHPAVGQAAAVGLPDDRLGEVVAAFVVADAGLDLEACRAWCIAEGLARHKIPERLEVLDALPVLATGKVDKAALRTRAAG